MNYKDLSRIKELSGIKEADRSDVTHAQLLPHIKNVKAAMVRHAQEDPSEAREFIEHLDDMMDAGDVEVVDMMQPDYMDTEARDSLIFYFQVSISQDPALYNMLFPGEDIKFAQGEYADMFESLTPVKEDASSPVFQIMKKSLLRHKWYLENEEMDPNMVSSELRDVNKMIEAVDIGEHEPYFDTAVNDDYRALYREAIAKSKGKKTSIYGVDNDVLPLNAKPNPKSAYNSGEVEKNDAELDALNTTESEVRRLRELSGIKETPVKENFVDDMPHGLLDGMTFTDGDADYDYRGAPMNNGEVDWPEINDWHLDADGNVKPEATMKPEDFTAADLVPF
jgi:hypothetical protein